MPQHDFPGPRRSRSQYDGFLLTNVTQRALRFLPYQQQLHLDDCRRRSAGTPEPFDEMATDDDPGAPTSGAAFAPANCATLPYHEGLGLRSFDHSTTGFALIGTHASPSPTPCASCHVSNNYTLNSADCMGLPPGGVETAPLRSAALCQITSKAGFPSTARLCPMPHHHEVVRRQVSHTRRVPLTNSHALVTDGGKVPSCASCHINQQYS